jgi:hypothetical protein
MVKHIRFHIMQCNGEETEEKINQTW